jgi:hypothetical protein
MILACVRKVFSPALAEWLNQLELDEDTSALVLAHLCENGATKVDDLAELEQKDVDELVGLVPRFKQKVSRSALAGGRVCVVMTKL